MSTKRAILIGCNYTATPQAQLQGCIDDIVNVNNMLIDAYGYLPQNITLLRDDTPSQLPTKANILAALKAAMAASAGYSELWIHYSGHGVQVADTNGDELFSDRLDEAIVPSDYLTAGFIVDDDLFTLLKQSACRTLVFLDSCHSGSACDLQYSLNYGVGGALTLSMTSSKAMSNPNVIMMSGSRDAQTSADSYNNFSKDYEGAFTMSLIGALRQSNHSADIVKIYSAVCAILAKSGYTQIPVLSCSSPSPAFQFARAGVQTVAPVLSTPATTSSSGKPVGKSVSDNGSLLRKNMSSVLGRGF